MAGNEAQADHDMEEKGDVSDEQLAVLKQQEEALAANPADYDGHLTFIAQLKDLKLKEQLRAARCRFSEQFPLSAALWTEWLLDEFDAVENSADVAFLLGLFDSAVEDYVSVDLWHQYLEVALEIDEDISRCDAAGQEKAARLFQRALSACGLHVTAGSAVHAQRRAFLARVVAAALEGGDESAASAAVAELRQAWHEQLRTPLADGADTMAAYTQWEQSLPEAMRAEVPAKLEKAFSKAQAAVAVRAAFEEAIADDVAADESLLKAFLAYINYEQGAGDAKRITLLYERAIARFPVTVSLWEQLTEHLETTMRNCPWAGVLWAAWLRALERLAEEGSFEGGLLPSGQHWAVEHESVHTRALQGTADPTSATQAQAGLKGEEDYMQVLLARLDLLRRVAEGAPLTEAFRTATALMASYFPKFVDAELRLPQYWAWCEAEVNNDMGAAREVWRAALQTPALGKLWHAHEAYIALEAALGDVGHARAHFKSILSRSFAEPQGDKLCVRAWLRLEREHGSAATLFAAKKRCRNMSAEVEPPPVKVKKPFGKKKKDTGATEKKAPEAETAAAPGTSDSRKNKAGLGFVEEQPAAKRAKVERRQDDAAAPPSQGATDAPQAPQAPQAPEENTLFIKHLPTDVTAEQIRDEVLAGHPGVKDIRIGTKDGVGRGFAYVEMQDAAAAQAAVKDRNDLKYGGKHLLIAISRPPAGQGAGRGSGRGRGSQSRGRGRGRGRGRDAERGEAGRGGPHMHRRVDIGGSADPAQASATVMMPRSVQKAVAPKSNEDFRKMLG